MIDIRILNDFVIQEPKMGVSTLNSLVAAGADVPTASGDCFSPPVIALGHDGKDSDNLFKMVIPDGGIESPRTSQGLSVTIHNECVLGICNCDFGLCPSSTKTV